MKFTLPLVPPGVVTLTVLVPVAAVPAIVQLAATELAVDEVTEQDTPVPDTVTADAFARFVPLSVTAIVVPSRSAAGTDRRQRRRQCCRGNFICTDVHCRVGRLSPSMSTVGTWVAPIV